MVTKAVRDARNKKRGLKTSDVDPEDLRFGRVSKSFINFRFPVNIRFNGPALKIEPGDKAELAKHVRNKMLEKMRENEQEIRNNIVKEDPTLEFAVEGSKLNIRENEPTSKSLEDILGGQDLDLDIDVGPEWHFQDKRGKKTSSWKKSKRTVLKVSHLPSRKAPMATKLRNTKGMKPL